MTRRVITARDQVAALSPWRTAGLALDWKPARFGQSWARLENGHTLAAMPPSQTNPDRGAEWYLWTGGGGDEDVTGGGRGWEGDPRAHSTDHLPTIEHAMAAAEEAYAKLYPIGTDTGPHDSGVDYSDLNKFLGEGL